MTERRDKAVHAASFGSVAEVYEASRPGYPAEAVDWLVPTTARRVADVGAGTGKFTRLLERSGREIIAVDPSEQMLGQLRAASPAIEAVVGTGERIPLDDGSVDAVTFAQAWHWVDAETASAEVGRVLRPGGILGLVWNLRDERVDWVRRMGEAMHADGDQFTDGVSQPQVAAPFHGGERADFAWTNPSTREGLLELVRSRSYFAVMSPDEQRSTLADVAELLDTHPQTAGREVIEMPYVTVCFRYERPE
jgi:SAM-dependent methyltransferase